MSPKIRFMTKLDSNAVLSIYSPYILNTAITFEYVIPSGKEFEERMGAITQQFPYLVCEIDGEIVGYAYASKYRERKAYQWNCELSVYIMPEHKGKRIATAFYHCLIELLKAQGYKNVYTVVNADNATSFFLHNAFGFEQISLDKNTGYKFGKWHDISTLHKQIGDYDLDPAEPKPICEIDPAFIANVLKAGKSIME